MVAIEHQFQFTGNGAAASAYAQRFDRFDTGRT
jgi:hypothetical protein